MSASLAPAPVKDRVLMVDDDLDTLELLTQVLEAEGYEVSLATNGRELKAKYSAPQPDVVLLDLRLPDADGLDLLPQLKSTWPETQVIVLTSFGTFDAAVEAVKRGAFHFQSKPFEVDGLLMLVKRACEHKHLTERSAGLQKAVSTLTGGRSPIFKSLAMRNVLHLVERIASSDASVLLTGESGTGKEVITDLLHSLSARPQGPLVKVNCAALPRELIESELFGAVKGAYTGAHVDREGLFKQAQGGTIMLDEIVEMPLETQSKLLRVLQEKEYRPVGGKTSQKADCRIVATTNRKVEEAIQANRLREDLFYRISALTVHLSPLRERKEDILPLANVFLRRFAAQAGRNIKGFSPQAAEALERFDWPGNVRQLENEVQRAVLIADGDVVQVSDLSINSRLEAKGDSDLGGLEVIEKNAVLGALEQAGGNKAAAARQLGVTRQTLYNKMKYYGLGD